MIHRYYITSLEYLPRDVGTSLVGNERHQLEGPAVSQRRFFSMLLFSQGFLGFNQSTRREAGKKRIQLTFLEGINFYVLTNQFNNETNKDYVDNEGNNNGQYTFPRQRRANRKVNEILD